MVIVSIEQSIINQLKTAIPDLKVDGFPDKPENYPFVHPKGVILVAYVGASYDQPFDLESGQQTASLEFGVNLIVKGVRDKNGAYSYIDKIIECLTGFQALGVYRIYPSRVNFISQKAGEWEYGLTFSVQVENYNTKNS